MKKSTKKDRSIMPIYSYTIFGKEHYVIRDREIALCVKKCIEALCDESKRTELDKDEVWRDWLDLQIWAAIVRDEEI